jgi:hypothetical protein
LYLFAIQKKNPFNPASSKVNQIYSTTKRAFAEAKALFVVL